MSTELSCPCLVCIASPVHKSSWSKTQHPRFSCSLLRPLWFLMAPVPSSEAAVTIDVHAAKGLVDSGHKYLDVRTTEEFKKGHPRDALNVPYLFFTPQGREKNPGFVEQASLICDKDDHIVVGCQSGARSLKATDDLLKAGFKLVKNMGGGYAAWVENGFPVKSLQEEKI